MCNPMKTPHKIKILKVFYLVISNFVIFYFLHKIFFSIKLSEIFFNLFISISALNFAIILLPKATDCTANVLTFITTEYFIGLFIILFFTNFFFIPSEECQISYWLSIFFASILGGAFTLLNFANKFKTKFEYRKILMQIIAVSLTFPLINLIYSTIIYKKTYYDLSFNVFVPEILIVIVWQTFIFLILKKGCT